jgi:hypothetical protein
MGSQLGLEHAQNALLVRALGPKSDFDMLLWGLVLDVLPKGQREDEVA